MQHQLQQKDIFLLTPPFTQLNTPYPATAYLKGFLNTKNISSFQADLGIEVTLRLFSKQGLTEVFERINKNKLSEQAKRIAVLKDNYIQTIDEVIRFLQGKNPTLAHRICKRNFLPEAHRFQQIEDLNWAFGSMGTQDQAKHLATLYLEDLSDLIKETIDPFFGFSRYAERLGRCAHLFDELQDALQLEKTYVDEILLTLLHDKMNQLQPLLVAISVPFPGNLYSAFRCAQFIRLHYPNTTVVMGGGFPNTELRSLSDPRVFDYFHFITLDDGEAPIEQLYHYCLSKEKDISQLKRTFALQKNFVLYVNNTDCKDYKLADTGTPDYSDLLLNDYINALEVINPMHSLWSDGRWNKLTMTHGCYWGKCTFCDTSLDYISRYEPATAALICDKMEKIIEQTGVSGFHFVDEAAPPALMRAVAIEILKRKLVVSWWTNIRFEKSFTRDLCFLLKASGCIGVSGGLEVASDRLLQFIQKGITVAQVAKVNQYFNEAGIMVHAYLMYGFPTQTAQETIDSLEMVRQLFKNGILQSAYWHQFAMTAHSPVGLAPETYKVHPISDEVGSFANNDVPHEDPTGAEHEAFSYGLKKSLHNFMHDRCLDQPVHTWFDFKAPKTTIPPDYIIKCLEEASIASFKPTAKVIFNGVLPELEWVVKSKKGMQWEQASLTFHNKQNITNIKLSKEHGQWFYELLQEINKAEMGTFSMQQVKASYEEAGLDDFELFWFNKPMNQMHINGLWVV